MPTGSGSSGAGAAALVGPYSYSYTQINAASGLPIDLGSPFKVGQLVEPFAFFPTFFSNGSPNNLFYLGVDHGLLNPIVYDGNAPDNEIAAAGVSGLYDNVGRFPPRAVFRIKQDGVMLSLEGPASGLTVGSIIVWAFVWTP